MFGIKITIHEKEHKWALSPIGDIAKFRTHLEALEQLIMWWPTATYRTHTVEKIN